MSGALFQTLERTVRLLAPAEASTFLRKHESRLVAALDHGHIWLNVDSFLKLLRVALFARGGEAPEGVVQPLKLAWLPLETIGEGVQKVTWNNKPLPRRRALKRLRDYLQERIREAIASAGPFVREQIRAVGLHRISRALSAVSVERNARHLRRADLRALDREDDCALYPEGLDETLDHARLQERVEGERELRGRLREIATFVGYSHRLKDRTWELPTLSLFLSTRPPSYFDVCRRILYRPGRTGYSRDALVQVMRATNAVAGTRYQHPIGQVVEPFLLSLTGDREAAGKTRLILGNLVLEDTWWQAAATPTPGSDVGTPVLSNARFDGLRRVLEAARRAARVRRPIDGRRTPPALLVLPELSVPRAWFRELGGYIARDERIGLIVGVEYLHAPGRNEVINQAFGVFPCGYHSVAVIPWTKRNPAQLERDQLATLGMHLRSSSLHRRTAVETEYGRLSVLICSEMLEPQALAGLVGRVDLIAVPAWNQDTESFDHVMKSTGLLVHCYVGIANNGHYSDCRAWVPINDPPWRREVCRLIQRDADDVVWEDLATGQLRRFHDDAKPTATGSMPDGVVWRPLPPSWPR